MIYDQHVKDWAKHMYQSRVFSFTDLLRYFKNAVVAARFLNK